MEEQGRELKLPLLLEQMLCTLDPIFHQMDVNPFLQLSLYFNDISFFFNADKCETQRVALQSEGL